MKTWNDVVSLHDRAVADYASAAESVTLWNEAPSPGKWSPAQVTEHLSKTFEAIITEARGGPPMALRLKAPKRFIARNIFYRRILRGGAFPRGAPAPRETRPGTAEGEAAAAIARFRELGAEAVNAVNEALGKSPKLRFRHPYFGYIPVQHGMYVSARHIDHHRAQIEHAPD